MVKRSIGLLIGINLGTGAALAQDAATSDTQAPNNYGGGQDYGVARRDPQGRLCVTTPGLIGKPRYGSVTTCYPDPGETEKATEEGSLG
jgi:hypothetical protein